MLAIAVDIAIVGLASYLWLRKEPSTATMFAKVFVIGIAAGVALVAISTIWSGWDSMIGLAFFFQLFLGWFVGLVVLGVLYVQKR